MNFSVSPKRDFMKIEVVDMDSVSAIFQYAENNTAVLNFASYKNPGGMFVNGSKAQEECLCHESFLYNVLKENQNYYNWNNQHKNRALYLNRALYSPNIKFFHEDKELLEPVYEKVAGKYGKRFMRAADYASPSEADQEHLDVVWMSA